MQSEQTLQPVKNTRNFLYDSNEILKSFAAEMEPNDDFLLVWRSGKRVFSVSSGSLKGLVKRARYAPDLNLNPASRHR